VQKLRRIAEDIGKNVQSGVEELQGLHGKMHAEKVRREGESLVWCGTSPGMD
jgi:hypothetical protein